MLLGAVGCIGAWFEKKVLLFAVKTYSCHRNVLIVISFEVYHQHDRYFCGAIIWRGLCHRFQ